MSTIYGWAGKILRVNFTTGAITTEDTLPKYHDYVGGMGIGYKIIWDEVPMETKAYDEASKVVIAVGPLTASGVPCSGRTNISFLSSWSKGYSIVDAHMGGHIAHNIKFAGYDAIVLEGQSETPVYLKIEDDKVSIEDASDLWGKGTFAANAAIAKACGPEFDVATIGPAGENLVNMSCLITSVGNSGGAGVGAIMGSKKVKGIAVRGTGCVRIADPKTQKELCDYVLRDLIGSNNNHNVPSRPQSWSEYTSTVKNRWQGGPGVMWGKAAGGAIDTGEQPSGDINRIGYRATKGVFDYSDLAQKYIVKSGGCASCPIRCYSEYDIDVLAEYDLPTKTSNTCAPAGSVPTGFYPEGIHDFKDEGDAKIVIGQYGSRVLDDYGLWCNYGSIGREFTYCYNKGLIKEHLSEEEWNSIPWDLMKDGDPRWLDFIIGAIATKKGEISRFGEGTLGLMAAWGLDDSYLDAVDAQNQNVGHNGYPKHHSSEDVWQTGLLYNVMYNRDCMVHVGTNFVRSGSPFNEVIKPVLEGYFGEGCVDAPKAYTPINENKVKLAKWCFLQKQWSDMATICDWVWPMTLSSSPARNYVGDIEVDSKFLTAVTGETWSQDDLLFAAERVSQMLRVMTAISFKINENTNNLRTTHDVFSAWVFDKEPDFKAFEEGTVKMDREDMDKALTMFYEQMGWDTETGIPTRATLEKFGLSDMADKLEEYGILPA